MNEQEKVLAQECVARGGHCWESAPVEFGARSTGYPEKCKHCPATRVGHEWPDHYDYKYPEGQP